MEGGTRGVVVRGESGGHYFALVSLPSPFLSSPTCLSNILCVLQSCRGPTCHPIPFVDTSTSPSSSMHWDSELICRCPPPPPPPPTPFFAFSSFFSLVLLFSRHCSLLPPPHTAALAGEVWRQQIVLIPPLPLLYCDSVNCPAMEDQKSHLSHAPPYIPTPPPPPPHASLIRCVLYASTTEDPLRKILAWLILYIYGNIIFNKIQWGRVVIVVT